jgi:hypothetical protein
VISCVKDPFIREKFTRERSAARKLAQEYFQRISKRPISFWRHPEDNSQAAMYAELKCSAAKRLFEGNA